MTENGNFNVMVKRTAIAWEPVSDGERTFFHRRSKFSLLKVSFGSHNGQYIDFNKIEGTLFRHYDYDEMGHHISIQFGLFQNYLIKSYTNIVYPIFKISFYMTCACKIIRALNVQRVLQNSSK